YIGKRTLPDVLELMRKRLQPEPQGPCQWMAEPPGAQVLEPLRIDPHAAVHEGLVEPQLGIDACRKGQGLPLFPLRLQIALTRASGSLRGLHRQIGLRSRIDSARRAIRQLDERLSAWLDYVQRHTHGAGLASDPNTMRTVNPGDRIYGFVEILRSHRLTQRRAVGAQ